MVTEVEVIELVVPFVELREMIGGSTGRGAALGMSETVGRVLTAARSRNCHRRHAIGRHGMALVGTGNFGGDAACADEGDVGRPFDGGA